MQLLRLTSVETAADATLLPANKRPRVHEHRRELHAAAACHSWAQTLGSSESARVLLGAVADPVVVHGVRLQVGQLHQVLHRRCAAWIQE